MKIHNPSCRPSIIIWLVMNLLILTSCQGQEKKSSNHKSPAEIKTVESKQNIISKDTLTRSDALRLIKKEDSDELPEHLKPDFELHPFGLITRRYGNHILYRHDQGLVRHDTTNVLTEINIMELTFNTLLYSTDYGSRFKRKPIVQKLEYYDSSREKVLYTTDLVALNPYKHLPMIDTTFPDLVDAYNLIWDENCDYSHAPKPNKYVIDSHIESSFYGFHQVIYRLFGILYIPGERKDVVNVEETIFILNQQGKPIFSYKWDRILDGSAVASDGKTWIMTSKDYGGPLGNCTCMMQVIDIQTGKVLYFDKSKSDEFDYSGPGEYYKKDLFTGGKNDLNNENTMNLYYADLHSNFIILQKIPSESAKQRFRAGNTFDFYRDFISKFPFKTIKLK